MIAMVRPVVSVAALPVVFWLSVGTSAATIERKPGVAAPPLVGPANTRLAACVARLIASVPVVVTGEPEMDMIDGTVAATLLTVPLPASPATLMFPVAVGVPVVRSMATINVTPA